MNCAWQELIELLPIWMRSFVNKHGRIGLQELRLRVGAPPILMLKDTQIPMSRNATIDDLKFCVNMVTKYSPWSVSTVNKLYYTAPGGHRIGLCGTTTISEGQVVGIHELTSLCIRVARDFPGFAKRLQNIDGSILIIGSPGSGKTTLLRDFIREKSATGRDIITVIDERKEIFPICNSTFCFDTGLHTDIISGCSKSIGIECALRNMGPTVIAVDEITANEDCAALMHAGWCGVHLAATAHASSRHDLRAREIYRPLIESRIFDWLVVMRRDKSWDIERLHYDD